MFYVYEWFVVETGEIIYVGKGSGNRYKAKKKNKLLNRIIEKENCSVRIIAYYENELEAFEAERKRIVFLKGKNQAICNKAVYSTGGVANIWTEERRKEKSIHNPMKAPEQRERMSKNNPMKNSDVAKRVGLKHRKPIFIGDKTYSFAKDAAQEHGVTESTIFSWAKNGKTSSGVHCGYAIKEEKNIPVEISKEELSHSIIYDGKEFYHSCDVAKYAGIKSTSTIIRWCKKGFSPDGVPCRFKDDKTEYIYEKPNKVHTNKSFYYNGKHYNSIEEACKDLHISYHVFCKHYSGLCKYDNQQPSQGNFDNSTLDGSETIG